MKMNLPPDMPPLLTQVADACRTAGGRAMLVGGCVRDHLMGRQLNDWDVEVYGIALRPLEKLLRRLGPVNAVGRSFGVLKLIAKEGDIDVSLPRRDSNSGPGHKGIAVQGDPTMSIREAARRRDLTINAILIDIATGEMHDPFNGQQDIQAQLLRAVDHTTFLEDPLRAVRAVQFAARLSFQATPGLITLCREAALDELPAERIQGEWHKLMMKSRSPSKGLQLARQSGITRRVFPGVSDVPAHDAFIDRMAQRRHTLDGPGRQWAAMLTVWLHQSTAKQAESTLDQLWLHRFRGYPLRDRVLKAVAHWQATPQTDADLRNLSIHTELELTFNARWAITGDEEALNNLSRAKELCIAQEPPEPLLKGRHLTTLMAPGPLMGKVLERVYQAQLDGKVTTVDDAKAAVPQALIAATAG